MKCTVFAFLLLAAAYLKASPSWAQENAQKYGDIIGSGDLKQEYWQARNNKSEIQMAFAGLFLFYKSFFSSQDLAVCTFTPSCSEYGILAIKEHGMIKGGIMTMDRLTRCNGLSPKNYEVDQKTLLLKDDPRDKHLMPIVVQYK